MRAASPTWVDLFEDAGSTASVKACLILNAASFLENPHIASQHDFRIRHAVTLVGTWLEELRRAHPLYRRYSRSVNIHALNYYGSDSPSSSSQTSDTESPSDEN